MHPNRRPSPQEQAAREQALRVQRQRAHAERMYAERMQAQPQRMQQQQRAPTRTNPVRGSVPSLPQPHIPARRTQYKSAHDTTCEERNTDIKEILKNEIDKVGDKDVVYRLHRGDSSLVNMGRGDTTDSYTNPLNSQRRPEPKYNPGRVSRHAYRQTH